jgi:plastocyanin
MRFFGLALLSSTVILSACGGGGNADSTKKADTALAAPPPTPSGATVAAAPITGTTIEVKMIGDATGYRFEPANITAKPGDGIKFVAVSTPPHNVSFDPATVPPAAKDQLWANVAATNGTDGASPMLLTVNDTWTLSLGNLPPGKYPLHCTPHLAMAMKGELTIAP